MKIEKVNTATKSKDEDVITRLESEILALKKALYSLGIAIEMVGGKEDVLKVTEYDNSYGITVNGFEQFNKDAIVFIPKKLFK